MNAPVCGAEVVQVTLSPTLVKLLLFFEKQVQGSLKDKRKEHVWKRTGSRKKGMTQQSRLKS